MRALHGATDSPAYLLGLAGGYYTEGFGGADVHHINDAVVLEYRGGDEGLRTVYAVEQHGELKMFSMHFQRISKPDARHQPLAI